LDWVEALVLLNKDIIDKETLEETMGCIFKYREDMEKYSQEVTSKSSGFSIHCG
jgi:hypothetical protein